MAGRPPKYKTPEEMQVIIDQYFEKDAFVQMGDSVMYAPTVSGLAYALDMSRQGLLEYSEKDAFSDTIKKAKIRIEMALEQRLYGNTVTGTIFNLKNNFGWKDKSEQELSGPNGGAIPHQVTWTIQPVKPVNEANADDQS